MEILKIDGHTRIFGKPKDWKDEYAECHELYVKDLDSDAGNIMISEWKPSSEEV